jgi:putative ABC transport system permease protein
MSSMIWIALRMLTGDRQKFFGLLFGVGFSALLITQQLAIFVNLLQRGATAVYNVSTANIWVMDPVSRTPDVALPMPATALDKVRSVSGVEWASPLLRSGATIRTPAGDLEGVTVVGVDDATLIGLPKKFIAGDRQALYEPDAVFIDSVGAAKLFPENVNPIGVRLELNDRRAVIRGIVDVDPSFTSQVILYTRYSNALAYVPGTRNRLSFILAHSMPGLTPEEVARRINMATGLKARTREEFARDGVDFIIENTGIPINFGITVALGFIVGIAIVGLTFSLFIRDNIKQFGALKAIGVTNHKIRLMVAAQACMVGLIGYGMGVLLAAVFIASSSTNSPAFKGFYTPWQIPLLTGVVVLVMILITGWLALRSVLKTEPAEVFR